MHKLLAWIDNRTAVLDPGCFALVMATGIISNALVVPENYIRADSLDDVESAHHPARCLPS
jgi:hypothetical protein